MVSLNFNTLAWVYFWPATIVHGDGPQNFGHKLLENFTFPPHWLNLNQGSYGACPIAVQRARRSYQQTMDDNPEAFFRGNLTGDGHTVYSDLIDRARRSLAAYLRTDVNNLVLVDNASGGINAVLRSLSHFLRKGKAMLFLDTGYYEVKDTIKFLAGDAPGEPPSSDLTRNILQVNITDLMPNITRKAIVERVKSALHTHDGSVGLCTFSHITSTPGLVLPIDELIEACHKVGALVLIDGAHAPGNIPLDLGELDADFYVGNGHKWLFSPKPSAFLHVKQRVQKYVFPNVIDHGPDPTRFTSAFMWQGTADPSAFIAIHDALEWRSQLGEAAIKSYMASLAEAGGLRIAQIWGTSLLPSDVLERKHMQASLTNIRVPCDGPNEQSCPSDLAPRVTRDSSTFVPVGEYAGAGRGLWARVSASIYNEVSDFEFYAHAVLRALNTSREMEITANASALAFDFI